MSTGICRGAAAVAFALFLHAQAFASALFPEEASEVELPAIADVQLTYRAVDPQRREIGQRVIYEQLLRTISSATTVPRREVVRAQDLHIDGMRARLDGSHDIVLEYAAQSKTLPQGALIGQWIAIPLHVEVAKDDGLYHVRVAFPVYAGAKRVKPFLLPAPSLPLDRVRDDVKHLAQALSTASFTLDTVVDADVDSSFQPPAVFANFERLMGRPRTTMANGTGSTSLSGEFTYRSNAIVAPVQVTVFPYHDGSKVHYRASLTYTLAPDGTVRGDDAVGIVQSAVASIANN